MDNFIVELEKYDEDKSSQRLQSYQRFLDLITEKGITPYKVHKDTGIATATLSDWKNGKSTPKHDKMKKLANYLDVSLDYLTTGNEPQADCLYTDENAEFLIEVTNRTKRDAEFVRLMKTYMSLSKENQKSVGNMIDFLSEKEKKDEA